MTTGIASLRPEDQLLTAEALKAARGGNVLPFLVANGRLVGEVACRNVIRSQAVYCGLPGEA